MAAASNIVLADAAGTPVNHTFNPNGPDDKGVYWFVDTSQSNAIGYWRISVEVKRPPAAKAGESSANRSYRYIVGLHEPVLETLSNNTVSGILPAPTVAYIPRTFIEYIMSERTSLQNRKDLWKMSHLLAADTQIQGLVENLDKFTS